MTRRPSPKATTFAALAHAINREPPPHGCRYILDSGPPWRNCGKEPMPGSAYCAEHHLRCYVGQAPRRL